MMKPVFYIFLFCILSDNDLYGQKIDSITDFPKHIALGNSWVFAASHNFSNHNEFGFNIGRMLKVETTYRNAQEYNLKFFSWGAGYAYYNNGHLLSLYTEFSNYYNPPYTVRLEYIHDVTRNTNYIRPSLGLDLFIVDVLYNYSFALNNKQNLFKHGLTIRVKMFTKWDDWVSVYKNQYYKYEKKKAKK